MPLKEHAASEAFPWPAKTYAGKRLLDSIFSLIMLLAFLPLTVLIALAIKLTSRGPVFYKGLRAGQLNVPFHQLKFRTMSAYKAGGAFTAKGDRRVTAVGHLLRFFKLDEFPQFLNVLRGEMSVVGPRPEDVGVVERLYNRDQLRVLTVKPGLTCSLQVRIFPDFTHDIPEGQDPEHHYQQVILPQRLKEDMDYIDRMSALYDITIIMQTAWCIFFKSWGILWRRFSSPAGEHCS